MSLGIYHMTLHTTLWPHSRITVSIFRSNHILQISSEVTDKRSGRGGRSL